MFTEQIWLYWSAHTCKPNLEKGMGEKEDKKKKKKETAIII